MNRLVHVTAIASVMTLTAAAQASVEYAYVTDQSTYVTTPGDTVTVDVYIQETVTGGSSSTLVAEDGLFGAGAQIATTATPGSAEITSLTLNTGSDPFTQFFDNGGNTALGAASTVLDLTASLADTDAPQGPEISPGIRRILLGTLIITAGTLNSDFNVTDPSSSNTTLTYTEFLASTPTPLDDDILEASFTVAVPEPGAGVLMMVGLTLIGYRSRRGHARLK